MKNQTLFSLKDKSKQLQCHLLQFLFGTLRVKLIRTSNTDLDILHQVYKIKLHCLGLAL